ncbi:MAG: RNA-binding S4 domain-containing protein [Hyphomicrobiaceae bacterium]
MADQEGSNAAASPSGAQRLDKWLWFTRAVKTRTLAARLVTDGRVRVNRERVVKPSQSLRAGDVVTLAAGGHVRVLEVVAPGTRRGPPTEAQSLYRDLTPPRERTDQGGVTGSDSSGARDPGSGRPTKRDRRALDRLRDDE